MGIMTRRELWLMPLASVVDGLSIPNPRQFAKAIGLPKGWAIQKLHNIYSRRTGRLSLRWVSLYEIDNPRHWVCATLPTWEAAGRFAVMKIPPP
jgi:hypothetical protein